MSYPARAEGLVNSIFNIWKAIITRNIETLSTLILLWMFSVLSSDWLCFRILEGQNLDSIQAFFWLALITCQLVWNQHYLQLLALPFVFGCLSPLCIQLFKYQTDIWKIRSWVLIVATWMYFIFIFLKLSGCFGNLGNLEYFFIVIILKFILIWSLPFWLGM